MVDLASFWPIIKDFITHILSYFKWKEEDKPVERNYPEKNGICDELKNQGYRCRWEKEDTLGSREQEGWEIYYEENKSKRIRYRLIFRREKEIFIKKLE